MRAMLPRASTVFTPRAIPGLATWLDASDASTITLNGANVSQWRDKSESGGPHAAQSIAASQPAYTQAAISGRPAVEFDLSEQLTFTSSQAAFNFLHNSTGGTVIAAWRPDASSDPQAFRFFLNNSDNSSANVGIAINFDDRATGFNRNNVLTANINRGVANQSAGSIVSANGFLPALNTYSILSVAFDGGNATAANRIQAWANGVKSGATNTAANAVSTANAQTSLNLGGFATSFYALAELLIYQGVLSDAARQAIERYLAGKYGISLA